MTEDAAEAVGPFHYESPAGFEAWGFAFPSGYILLEWFAVPDSAPALEHSHQSIYHSFQDFRRINDGDVTWGRMPGESENPHGATDVK